MSDHGKHIPDPGRDIIIGEAHGVTYAVYPWRAGNTSLWTSFSYHLEFGCKWGADRKVKKQAIAEATNAYNQAQRMLFTGDDKQ